MISIGISIIFGILACIDKFEKQWELNVFYFGIALLLFYIFIHPVWMDAKKKKGYKFEEDGIYVFNILGKQTRMIAYQTMEKAVPAVYMLLFGLGAKTVMGFSPTVFASGNRTGLFLLIGVITATVLVYEAAEEKLPDWVRVCGLGIYSLFGMYVMTMQIVALWLA